jgi:hypothetical protein
MVRHGTVARVLAALMATATALETSAGRLEAARGKRHVRGG